MANMRTAYDGVRVAIAYEPGVSCTRREFKDECDINRIMKRAVATGELPVMRKPGLFGDFSEVGDFMEAHELVERAREQFSELPAETRERFGNEPAAMLAFVADKANKDEAIKLGLIATPPVPAGPIKVEVVAPNVPAGGTKP